MTLRVGARASKMSLMQTASVLSALSAAGPTILRPFTEAGGGDRSVNRAALEADGGVFSEEIESALLAGEIDVAVHCLKDAPTIDTPGLTMSAYLRRDDIRDCLVARDPDVTLATLPAGGAKVATAPYAGPPLCASIAQTSTSCRYEGRWTNASERCTSPTAGSTRWSSPHAPWNASACPT